MMLIRDIDYARVCRVSFILRSRVGGENVLNQMRVPPPHCRLRSKFQNYIDGRPGEQVMGIACPVIFNGPNVISHQSRKR